MVQSVLVTLLESSTCHFSAKGKSVAQLGDNSLLTTVENAVIL